MTLNNDDAPDTTPPEPVYWKLAFDINLPRPKVKVHRVEWDEEVGALFVYVSTSGRKRSPEKYIDGIPLYQPNEFGYDQLVGLSPVDLSETLALEDRTQTIVKHMHNDMADRLLGSDDGRPQQGTVQGSAQAVDDDPG